ncbi:polysaccharide pyruvyl transferase family protein [Niallia circulans]|uniref:polysaccharide pyruvyl transferase family protein n=1 Tax=Niallia circulans TaxID=1397 RepID=UPI003D96CB5A
MKKITVMNAYTWFNKGDAGILLGTLNEINRVFSKENIEINILSFTPEVDNSHYGKVENVKRVYSNILNPYPFNKTKKGKFIAITKLAYNAILNTILFFIFRGLAFKKMKQLSILKESDIIIVCGGGFLGGKKFNSLMHLYQIFIATFLERPVVIWGTSIEPPSNSVLKKITERILKRTTHILPREEVTYNYVQTFMNKDQFSFTPDLAFMVPKENSEEVEYIWDNLIPRNKKIIGLTVRDWHFPRSEDKEKALENYKKTIVETITTISQELNSVFVFIPQVIFQGDDDRIIAKEIKSKLEKQESLIILENDISPNEIKELISRFDMFLGTRMHSNIFALGAEVPTVAIAYEHKTNGIMGVLELDDYVIDIEDVTPEKLNNLVNKCYKQNKELRNKIAIKIPEVQNRIKEKSAFIRTIAN